MHNKNDLTVSSFLTICHIILDVYSSILIRQANGYHDGFLWLKLRLSDKLLVS